MVRTPPPHDDDAALRWDDVDDPSYAESSAAHGAGAEEVADSSDDAEPEASAQGGDNGDAPRRSSVTTLLTGLFGGIYLAYSVGWILGVGLVPLTGPTLLLEILYQFSEFLAIIASALWFGAAVILTRGGRAAHRLGWLALGSLVLIPWPLVLEVIP
jgi:hypothetical protein